MSDRGDRSEEQPATAGDTPTTADDTTHEKPMAEDPTDRLDRLESLVEQQQEMIERQQATIQKQCERIADLDPDRTADGDDGYGPAISRRGLLGTGGLLALLVGGAGTATADAQGEIGTSSDPLNAVHTEELNGGVTGDTALTDLLGDGLQLSSNALTADLNQVGSGVGVLDGIGSSGIDHRSLSGADGVSVTESGGTITVGATSTSVQTDSASTFQESGVTVTTDGTTVNQQAIEWSGPASTATVTPATNSITGSGVTGKHGLEIVPQVDLYGLTASVNGKTTGADQILLTDDSLNALVSKSFTTGSVDFFYPLSAGQTYYVLVEGSTSYDVGLGSIDFPVTSTTVDVTLGYGNAYGGRTDRNGFAFDSITGKEVARTTVEFPSPSSVSRWESATYQYETSGGFLRVYPQTSSDGGSSWSDWRSAPIGSGEDLSAVPPDDRLRFRLEFGSRSGSNGPRVTLLNRQYSP